MYRSEDGKLYWNKELPVYIRMASTPDEKGELLKSEGQAEYADPYFFDTEGANYIRTRWAVDKETKQKVIPEMEVMWEVYADGLAPITAIHYNTGNLYKENGVLFIGKDAKIDLTTKDDQSGSKQTFVSLDGQPYSPFTPTSINLNTEKPTEIKFYSVDNVGNPEIPNSVRVSTDLSAPVTLHTIGGISSGNVLSRNSTITLSADDKISGVSKILYTIDNSKELVYGDRIYVSWLEQGDHQITYYAVDNVNNKEVVKTFKFFIDKEAPTVITEIVGDQFRVEDRVYFSGRTKLQITAIDNKAGVKELHYSINGAEFQEYENKPTPLPTTASSLTIRAYGTDKVENQSTLNEGKSTIYVLADLSGPSLSAKYDGPTFETRDTIFISKHTKVQLLAYDAKSGVNKITYQINQGTETDYTTPFTVEKEAFHHVDFVGYDNVNNTNKSDFFFYVDNTGPESFTRYSIDPLSTKQHEGKTINVYSQHIQVFLSATDAHVGLDKIEYSINDGKMKPYVGVVKDFKKGKVYSITIKSYDTLGNSSDKTEFFAIED